MICYHMVTYERRRSDPGVLDVTHSTEEPIRIKLTSVYLNDQKQALRFSTDVLGFVTFDAFDH
jgi:hypothetical protein